MRHRRAYRALIGFLALATVLILMGQTMAIVDYDFAVRLGLQESLEQVGPFGVQLNRAFGASDTLVYLPLLLASLIGLWQRRRWAIATTAAAAGISAYWSATIAFVLLFAPGVPGYNLEPGIEYAVVLGAFALFGAWCLGFLGRHGEALLALDETADLP